MADALVSVILEQLDVILQHQEQEVKLMVGVEKELRTLSINFRAIQDVLEDAIRRQVKEPTVEQWLDKLKEVCYDMDDLLDECNTVILKLQIERDENAPKPKRKVCSLISPYFPCTQVALRAVKIKQLDKTLDVIAIEKERYNFTSTSSAKKHIVEMRMNASTASFIDVSAVHGRDDDKKKIVDMLLSESSQGPTLRIISIVGMGGIGKTTLAQLVYNDDAVKAHFQKRIWVCVSDLFDEIRIAKAILEVLKKDASNLNELDSLLQSVRDSIMGEKFLLVLDDVWDEDRTRFEQVKNSLNCGSPGSKILVTTRKVTVAEIMGTTDIFQLGQLSNEECWLLFSKVAFFGRSREECEKLRDIGWGIVDKCKGLPLAAKVLGGFLSVKNTREQWLSVLDTEGWELEEAESGLFPSLLLSYYDLSPRMRQCFSYCAIFPKDYNIEKDRLINLWMAQGYVRATNSIDMEMDGEECFNKLTTCSFLQTEKDSYGTIMCKMHNIMHDFAQFLTKNECFVMEVNGPKELMLDFPHARHSMLMLMLTERVSIPISISSVKNLRSLIIEYKRLQLKSADLSKVFGQLTCLRTLEFIECEYYGFSLTKLPKEIGKLTHLRYLNLANNDKLENLPETVCDLCNLQTLNVSRCRSLKKLPQGLGKLINLRHLEIVLSGVSFMPKGVEILCSLQTLDTFYVSSAGNVYEVSTLEDLGNLNHLRGYLEIRGLGKVRDMDEVKKAELKNKKHLIRLGLDFGWEEAEGRMINDKQVIEAIQPPPNLEELSIVEYRGTVFPNWMMSLAKLRHVQICKCENCKLLPPLGKLPSLESLIIGFVKTKNLIAEGGMGSVKRVGTEFLGIETDVNKNEGPSSSSMIAFPELKDLCFQCMFEWEEWDYGEEDITTASTMTIMRRPWSLKIRFCPKLKALPNHLLQSTWLEVLEISFCPILEERYYKERKGEDWPKISHIPNIVINYNYVQKDGRLVPSVFDSADATKPQLYEGSSSTGEYHGYPVPMED